MMKLFNKKGQSIAEYALILGLVTSAIVGVQAYVRSNLQHKVKESVDMVGDASLLPGGGTGLFTLTNPTGDAKALVKGDIDGAAYSKIETESGSITKEAVGEGAAVTKTTAEGSSISDGVQKFKY